MVDCTNVSCNCMLLNNLLLNYSSILQAEVGGEVISVLMSNGDAVSAGDVSDE